MNWQKFETFSPKKLTSESFDNDNKLTLKTFFAFCSVFCYEDQRRKDGNDFATDTVSAGFQTTPELKRAKTYSALSFDQINFFKMANLFWLSRKLFVMCYCFREPITTFFLRLSNDCQIARPELVSGPPNWKKPYNKHLITVRTENSANKRYRKIPKINPGAYIFQRPFLGSLFLEGLIYRGKFAFQNRLD